MLAFALLPLGPASDAAAQAVPPDPPAGKDNPGPQTVCPKKRGYLCLDAQVSPRTGELQARKKQRAKRVRKGTTLPSLKKLFGRKGTKAAKLADKWIGRRVSDVGARAAATRTRAAGTKLTKVGRVGKVRVDAGIDGDIASSDQELREEVVERDRLRAGRVSQIRSFRYGAVAGACPDPGNPRETHGKVAGRLRAEQLVTTVQRKGKRELRTTIGIEVSGYDGPSAKMHGLVDQWAHLYEVRPSDGGLFGDAAIRLFRTRVLRNTRTGKVSREEPIELFYDWQSIDPVQISRRSDFSAFVERHRDDDDDPADRFQSDRLLREEAFDGLATAFAKAVAPRVRALYKRQENVWRTPNRCLRLNWDPPSRMAPGESREIRVDARSNEGYSTEQLSGQVGYMAMSRQSPLEVKPYVWGRPDSNAGQTYTLAAPAKRWDGGLQIYADYYGKAGIASVGTPIEAADEVLRYEVLSADFETFTAGAQSGSYQPCGSASGTTTFTGARTSPYASDQNRAEQEDWGLEGRIAVPVPAEWQKELNGCTSPWDDPQPCTVQRTENPVPAGTWEIGFSITAPSMSASQAKLNWWVDDPSIGYIDADDSVCNVFEVWNYHEYGETTETVSMDKLLQDGPVTFTYSGGPRHWDQTALGHPADLTMSWTYTLTVKRVQ